MSGTIYIFSDFIPHAVLYWEDGHHEQSSAVMWDILSVLILPDVECPEFCRPWRLTPAQGRQPSKSKTGSVLLIIKFAGNG
ncbi:hypothetical protein [Pseudoalteromonas aurantia]|uniref:hypothetical protein n=1 Tax=Pseudoalteromonas aurantia TaxID=43654 RepID=UPI00148756E2|nr:hypothetical protein [Pseudoalteromonas aurantia]